MKKFKKKFWAEANVKGTYIIAIFFIVALIVALILVLIFSFPEGEPYFGSIAKNAPIFIACLTAILAAVIALSSADPKKKKVEVVIAPPYIEEERTYEKDDLTHELKVWYKDLPDPIRSHQVHFKITNQSDLTLMRPILTFRIPVDKKHPNKREKDEKWHWQSFNSNLYNSTQELKILEFADTSILSNSNLPYWNYGEDLTFWIRMVIDDGKLGPFDVVVSVNCENAGGFMKRIKIIPKDLLKSISEHQLSEESHE